MNSNTYLIGLSKMITGLPRKKKAGHPLRNQRGQVVGWQGDGNKPSKGQQVAQQVQQSQPSPMLAYLDPNHPNGGQWNRTSRGQFYISPNGWFRGILTETDGKYQAQIEAGNGRHIAAQSFSDEKAAKDYVMHNVERAFRQHVAKLHQQGKLK